MRISVWKTGHEIADTVAQSLAGGLNGEIRDTRDYEYSELNGYDAHIGYGILRGTGDIYRRCEAIRKEWLHLDRGYFEPHHFNGYYRISHKGTQAKYDPAFPITNEYEGELLPWRKDNKSKPVLICPPTNHVMAFFGMPGWNSRYFGNDYVMRIKGDPNPINWEDYRAVITFNSSVGWEALRRGIPCISNPLHSVVGSYYDTISIDNLIEMVKSKPRKPLFDFMSSHQFTLDEIRKGDAWPLIKHYTSLSDGIHAKQSVQMSQPTASDAAPRQTFNSIFSNTAN